jgi:hypothetical protein
MSKMMRQPFTPGGKFIASKNFRFHGRDYARGDEFPWRRLSCSIRKLRQLYEGRYLNNEYVDEEEIVGTEEELMTDLSGAVDELDEDSPDEDETDEDESDEDDSDEDELDEDETDEDESEEDEELTVYDPEVHEIVNPVKGEWYLDKDGVHLMRLYAKEAKRLMKKLEPEDIDLDRVHEE